MKEKKNEFKKKLVLKKESIADLTKIELQNIKGQGQHTHPNIPPIPCGTNANVSICCASVMYDCDETM